MKAKKGGLTEFTERKKKTNKQRWRKLGKDQKVLMKEKKRKNQNREEK